MKLADLSWPHFVTVLITAAVVIGAVLLHYEGLSWTGRLLKRRFLHHRAKILVLIFAQLGLHIAEIWLFAAGYAALTQGLDYGVIWAVGVPGPPPGRLLPPTEVGFLDLVYFSAVTFSTVGFGDIVPTGVVRFMTGTEALTGFVLITWSASFTFLEMQRYWGRD